MSDYSIYSVKIKDETQYNPLLLTSSRVHAFTFAFKALADHSDVSVVRFDDYSESVTNINKEATVADFFYLTGKLPGGYIRKSVA